MGERCNALPRDPDLEPDASMDAHNDLSGHVGGSVVQTGVVYGGIHFHGEASPPQPTPRQLPRVPPHFTDRADETAALDRLVAPDARAGGDVMLLSGPAGVGKTALAVRWLADNVRLFPDGQLYADLSPIDGPASPASILRGFLTALGVAPERLPLGLADAAVLYRSVTVTRRIAVLLDNAVTAAQVRPLIPAGLDAVTVVTSRWQLSGLVAMDGAQVVLVRPLPEDAAVVLLEHVAGTARVVSRRETVRELVALCGWMPLAIRAAGARLALRPSQSMVGLVAELRDERQRLSRLVVEEDGAMRDVRDVFDVAYAGLSGAAARCYRVLGVLPLDTVTEEVAAAALGTPAGVTASLDQLVAANLLEPVDERSYRFHDLVRVHAAGVFDRVEPPEARADVIARAIDWYLDTAITAGATVRPYGRSAVPLVEPSAAGRRTFPDMNAALDWLDEEAPRLLSLVGYAMRGGLYERGLQLAHQMWALFAYRKYYAIWLEFDQLGLECARALGDTAGQARMLRRLGLLHTETGDYAEAADRLRESAELWRTLGDRHRIATVLNSLGVVRMRSGDPAGAVTHLEHSLALHRRLAEAREASLVLVDLADALTEIGRPREAIDRLEEAWLHLSSSPDTFSRAHLRALLGRALAHVGRLPEAERLLAEAEAALQGVESPSGQAEVYGYLGELTELAGRPDLARLHYRRAREILADLGVLETGWLAARLRPLTPLTREVFGPGTSALP